MACNMLPSVWVVLASMLWIASAQKPTTCPAIPSTQKLQATLVTDLTNLCIYYQCTATTTAPLDTALSCTSATSQHLINLMSTYGVANPCLGCTLTTTTTIVPSTTGQVTTATTTTASTATTTTASTATTTTTPTTTTTATTATTTTPTTTATTTTPTTTTATTTTPTTTTATTTTPTTTTATTTVIPVTPIPLTGMHIANGALKSTLTTLATCIETCRTYTSMVCTGVDFDTNGNLCYFHSLLTECNSFIALATSTHYRFVSCGSTTCGYTQFPVAHIVGGMLLSTGGTPAACQTACCASTTCAGYDYNTSDLTCWMHFIDSCSASLSVKAACTHYSRTGSCPALPTLG